MNANEAMIHIRPPEAADLEAIRAILNAEIRESRAVFLENEVDEQWARAWLAARDTARPALVAIGEGRVVGWGSIGDYASRAAYQYTGEISIYVDAEYRHHGVGRRLAIELEKLCVDAGLHSLVAVIEAGNLPSRRMFESLDYRNAGLLEEVGRKFGEWLDVAYCQKILESPAFPPRHGLVEGQE